MSVAEAKTISEIASSHPESYKIFHKYGIDFCCGGKRSLTDVCQEQNISADEILAEIKKLKDSPTNETDWQKEKLSDLIDHIVSVHHGLLRQELPRLNILCNKVGQRHGDNNPFLHQVLEVYTEMAEELILHMGKEERILFPAIKAMEENPLSKNNIKMPIHLMETEHEDTGTSLMKLSELTGNYEIKDDMCNSFKALYQGLSDIEKDIQVHIHKENNILFPRSLKLISEG